MIRAVGDREFEIMGKKLDGWIVLANFSSMMNFLLGAMIIVVFTFNITVEAHWLTRALVFGASWDAIDGRFARRSKYKSNFGSKVDTYADLVTFGLAPTMMIIDMLKDVHIIIALTTALLYVYGSSFRLSRFMIGGTGKSFSGMPTPVAAIFVGSFYVVDAHWIFMAFSFLLISFIMVSSYTYTAMKSVDNKFDQVHFVFGIVLMLLLTYIPTPWIGIVAWVLIAYIYYFIIVGPFHASWRKL